MTKHKQQRNYIANNTELQENTTIKLFKSSGLFKNLILITENTLFQAIET